MLNHRNIKHDTTSFSLLFNHKLPYSEYYDRALLPPSFRPFWACRACPVPDARNTNVITDASAVNSTAPCEYHA